MENGRPGAINKVNMPAVSAPLLQPVYLFAVRIRKMNAFRQVFHPAEVSGIFFIVFIWRTRVLWERGILDWHFEHFLGSFFCYVHNMLHVCFSGFFGWCCVVGIRQIVKNGEVYSRRDFNGDIIWVVPTVGSLLLDIRGLFFRIPNSTGMLV